MRFFKKYYVPVVLLLILAATSCGVNDAKEKYTERPRFDFQKTYLLRQVPFYFSIYYNIWKNVPVDLQEFGSLKDIKGAKLYDAHKVLQFIGNSYIIEDNENKKNYLLKQENKSSELIKYSVSLNKKELAVIKQLEAKNILSFEVSYKDRIFEINGEMRKADENVFAFVYEIRDKEKNRTLGKIFKEYRNFMNEYEIYINREFGIVEDHMFITLGIFIDQILRENGYQYK
jgi:hypothetical protein